MDGTNVVRLDLENLKAIMKSDELWILKFFPTQSDIVHLDEDFVKAAKALDAFIKV